MGATKELDATPLGVGSAQKVNGNSIVEAFVSTTEGTTQIKNRGKTWVTADSAETLLWKTRKSGGMFKPYSVIEDSSGAQVATIITAKKGMASCTNYIFKSEPTFDGQSPMTEEEMKKCGIDGSPALYPFAQIKCTRTLTTAKCTYGIATGPGEDDVRPLYEGEKLSSMAFKAIFKEATGGAVVTKGFMPGMTMSPHIDSAIGVDLLAIVSMGYALAGDSSGAGALAGAGVV